MIEAEDIFHHGTNRQKPESSTAMRMAFILLLVFVLTGCQSVSQTRAPQDPITEQCDRLRTILFDERRSGRATLYDCRRAALEAARLNNPRIDRILINFYADTDLDVTGPPRQIALQLHSGRITPVILEESHEGGLHVYNVMVSEGPLSGGRFKVQIVDRNGYHLPISNEVASIY